MSAASTTADTPRAHITNMAAMGKAVSIFSNGKVTNRRSLSECLRDIRLEAECNRLATDNKNMMHTTWAYSMTGEEYARMYSWGHDPARKVRAITSVRKEKKN